VTPPGSWPEVTQRVAAVGRCVAAQALVPWLVVEELRIAAALELALRPVRALALLEPQSACCSHWASFNYSAGFDPGAAEPDSRPDRGRSGPAPEPARAKWIMM